MSVDVEKGKIKGERRLGYFDCINGRFITWEREG